MPNENNICGKEVKSTNYGGGVWGTNIYPSSSGHGGGFGGFSGGNSYNYVATDNDLRIRTIYKSLGNNYYGCQGDNSRKEKGADSLCSSLKYVINEIKLYNGYSPTAKAFIFSDCDLTAHDTNYLSANLPNNAHNFILVDFSHNPQIGPLGVDYLLKGATGILSLQSGNHDINLMYQGLLTRPNFNVVKLNLENCNIGDIGSDILGHALANGKLPATKEIDVSGNNITEKGEFVLTEGMKKALNTDLNITFVKTGWKNTDPMWKATSKLALKEFLEHAKNQGIDTEHVATNKSTLDYIFNTGNIIKNMLFGWGKCSNVLLEILSFNTTAPSITKGFALEMYGTKAMKKADLRICMFLETHDAIVSDEGAELAVKAVDLLGGNE